MRKHFIKQFIKLVITLIFSFSMLYTVHYYSEKVKIKEPVIEKPNYEIIEDVGYYKPYHRFLFKNIDLARVAISLATMDTSDGTEKLWYTRNGFYDLYKYVGNPDYCPENFISITPKLLRTLNNLSYKKHNTLTWYENMYASCDLSVAFAVWWSGADDNYPGCLRPQGEWDATHTQGQVGYVLHDYSGNWMLLERGSKIIPGDIAFGRDETGYISHTWMYLAIWDNGRWLDNLLVQDKFPNSIANRYEGSYGEYYAKVGYDENPWLNSAYIFRYIGEIDQYSSFKSVK